MGIVVVHDVIGPKQHTPPRAIARRMPIFSPIAWSWCDGTSDSTRVPEASFSVYRKSAPRNALAATSARHGLSSSCTMSSGRSSTSTTPSPGAGSASCASSPSSVVSMRGPVTMPRRNTPCPTKSATKRVARPVVELVRRIPLLDAAVVHDADLVGERERFVLVVRHQDRRGAARLDDVAHFERQALAQIDVEVGERLVEQQQIGLRRERAGERHALLLAAGELVRIGVAGAREAHERQASRRCARAPWPTGAGRSRSRRCRRR